jgi:hypothetical protein
MAGSMGKLGVQGEYPLSNPFSRQHYMSYGHTLVDSLSGVNLWVRSSSLPSPFLPERKTLDKLATPGVRPALHISRSYVWRCCRVPCKCDRCDKLVGFALRQGCFSPAGKRTPGGKYPDSFVDLKDAQPVDVDSMYCCGQAC